MQKDEIPVESHPDDQRHPDVGRILVSSLSYWLAFVSTRLLAHAAQKRVGPFRQVSSGGVHVHHSFWGIFSTVGRRLRLDTRNWSAWRSLPNWRADSSCLAWVWRRARA